MVPSRPEFEGSAGWVERFSVTLVDVSLPLLGPGKRAYIETTFSIGDLAVVRWSSDLLMEIAFVGRRWVLSKVLFWLLVLALIVLAPAVILGFIDGSAPSNVQAAILAIVWILAIAVVLERLFQGSGDGRALIAPDRTRHGNAPPPAPRGRIPASLSPRDRMKRKLRTRRGRSRYALQITTVEPPFGQIKECQGFRRFSMRGPSRADAEWLLVCTAHNLLKYSRHAVRMAGGGSDTRRRRAVRTAPDGPSPAHRPVLGMP